jgi:hypothetical protein
MGRQTRTNHISPRLCAHRHLQTLERHGDVWVQCQVCGLQSEPVPIGWRFWSRRRALSKFYQLANKIDRGI